MLSFFSLPSLHLFLRRICLRASQTKIVDVHSESPLAFLVFRLGLNLKLLCQMHRTTIFHSELPFTFQNLLFHLLFHTRKVSDNCILKECRIFKKLWSTYLLFYIFSFFQALRHQGTLLPFYRFLIFQEHHHQ